MKVCSYCGQDNDDTVEACGGCATDLRPKAPSVPPKIPAGVGRAQWPDPLWLFGILVVSLGMSIGLEGTFSISSSPTKSWPGLRFTPSLPEIFIGAIIVILGLQLRKRALTASINGNVRRPLRLRLVVCTLPVLLVAYVLGYFVFMDRTSPTEPDCSLRFESSFRWASYTRYGRTAEPDAIGRFRKITVWNYAYDPLDKLWFHYHPRTPKEKADLRAHGYWWDAYTD